MKVPHWLRWFRIMALGLMVAWPSLKAAPVVIDPLALVAAARQQVGVTVFYDPAYSKMDYPGGDVPLERGVCCDVVIRALRAQQFDLQKEVHEDMAQHFSLYPKQWGLPGPDSNIDHRRVPNLMTFFKRRGWHLALSPSATDYQPGDIVTWNLRPSGSLPHIGIVSDRKAADGTYLVIHNIGRGAQEENALFQFTVIGHYRLPKKTG